MVNNNNNGVHNQNANGQMNQNVTNGVQNSSLAGTQQQRAQQQNSQQQPQNLQHIPPQQLAQLVQAMKNDFEIAKNATDEQVKQHHLNRAENIRRVLAKYQAQRNRLQQQQQQQRQMNSQLPQLANPGLQQQTSMTGQSNHIPQQNVNNNSNTNNNNFNQFQNMAQNLPAMNHSPAMTNQSPMLSADGIPAATSSAPKSRQSQVSIAGKDKHAVEELSKQRLQQNLQQQQFPQQMGQKQGQNFSAPNLHQYRNMLGSMSSTNSSGAGSGTAGSINLPSNTISMEKFNQIRQKLTEIQRKIQLLEQSKRAGNATPEQISIIDRELVEYKTKFQQFQKIGIYMRNQLVEQAKQQQQQKQQNHQVTPGQLPQQQQQQQQPPPPQQPHPQNPQPQSSPQMAQSQQHNQFQQGNNQQFSPHMSPQQRNSFQGSPPPIQQQQQQQQRQQLLAQHQRNIATGQQAVPAQLAATNMNGALTNQPLAHQSKQPSQAGTPSFPSALPTPSQQIQQQVPIQNQRAPSRQASATPQTQAHLAQQRASRQGSASSEKKPLSTGALPTASGTPNGSAAKSGSPGAEGRSTPQRPKSAMALNLAGITKPSVPSIPISSSVDIKPPTVVTFNPVTDTRPTLTGGGANSLSMLWDSPAITKLPTFDLEGGESTTESGRVLNKRKLQDIVGTVGVDEGDGRTTIDGNVEELLLDLADEFIYSVTSFACRLAKHRKVDSIDAKDVQLHLDQNWNIKIPGYAMDEIRSTRKYQPSTSYNQKIQGIEISKAVNGDI